VFFFLSTILLLSFFFGFRERAVGWAGYFFFYELPRCVFSFCFFLHRPLACFFTARLPCLPLQGLEFLVSGIFLSRISLSVITLVPVALIPAFFPLRFCKLFFALLDLPLLI